MKTISVSTKALLFMLLLLTPVAVVGPLAAQVTIPAEFSLVSSAPGVRLYESFDKQDYVQVVHLSLADNRPGAKIELIFGDAEATSRTGQYDDLDPDFERVPLDNAWKALSFKPDAFSVSNGAFFYDHGDSTALSFPLKIDGKTISGGRESKAAWELMALEIESSGADIYMFHDLEQSKANSSVLVGFYADANPNKWIRDDDDWWKFWKWFKEPLNEVRQGTTLVGLVHEASEGNSHDTMIIFNSKSTLLYEAVETLFAFGVERKGNEFGDQSKIVLFDGGGSSQLMGFDSESASKVYVPGDGRYLNQFIGVLSASPYEDLPSENWSYPYIDQMKLNGFFGFDLGNTPGSFDPNREVSRQEMARMTMRAAVSAGVLPGPNSTGTPFPDVPQDHLYFEEIQTLKNAGFINGDQATGRFRPEEPLNRAEMAAILQRTFDLQQPAENDPELCDTEDLTEKFIDVASDSWYFSAVRAVVNTWAPDVRGGYYRLAEGFEDDGVITFKPERLIKRVEIAKMLANSHAFALERNAPDTFKTSLGFGKCSAVGNNFEQMAIAVGAAPGRLLLDQGSTLKLVGEDPIRIAHRSAADSDGDSLIFHWSVDLGRLESTSANDQSVQYFPPSTTALTALATKLNQPTTAKLVASAIDNKGNFSRADVTLLLYPEGTEPPASSQGVQYRYDDLDRLVEADYGDGTKVEYTYDSLGNRLSRTVTVPTGDPDLSFASAVVPTPSTPTAGQSLQVTTTLANTGTSQASSFWIYGYFSTDETLSPDDVQLVSRLESPLNAGETRSWDTSFTLPSDLPGQSGHLLLELDATGAVAESNESNNLGAAPLTVLGAPPGDPPVADFTADATNVAPGESVAFTDLSTGDPTTWQWFFEGGTPSTSTEPDPVVTYAEAGNFDVRLTVTNVHGGNAVTRTGYITATNDTQPPTTRASLPGGVLTEPTPIELICEDDLSGCATTYFTLDGTTPTTGSAVYMGPITVGETALRFFSIDQAGNAESVVTEVYQLDTCVPPASGDWIVTESCELTRQVAAPADVIVEPGVVLTLAPTAILEIDLHNHKLLVKDTGGVLVRDGATLRQTSGTLQP